MYQLNTLLPPGALQPLCNWQHSALAPIAYPHQDQCQQWHEKPASASLPWPISPEERSGYVNQFLSEGSREGRYSSVGWTNGEARFFFEELDEKTCKWPMGHPNESSFYFCGRSSLKDFSYCKLHLLYAYQPKGKKEEVADKEEVPDFIGKKIQSA